MKPDIEIPGWLKTQRNPPPPVPGDLYPQMSEEEASRPVYIYLLIDPESGAPRYIGKSVRPAQRLQNHCNEKPSNCHRSHWIQSLRARGLKPEMMILESVVGRWPWQEAERYWIAKGRRLGWPLTNNTDGGDGVVGLPPEARAKMAATWKGRKHKPETIEKLKARRRERKTSPETRAKMSASQRGRKILWIDKVAEGVRKFDAEQIAQIKARLDAGELGVKLAREFGVHRTTLSKIKMGTYLIGKRTGGIAEQPKKQAPLFAEGME